MIRTAPFAALTGAFIFALAGCTASSGPQAAETTAPVVEETPTPAPVDAPEPTEEAEPVATPEPTPTPTLSVADCAEGPTAIIRLPADAYYPSYTNTARMDGEIFDTGPQEHASGQPTLNADGEIVSYTIRSGDTIAAIADRFCMGQRTLAAYNHTNGYGLQIGSTVVLRPDPNEPWSRDR